MLDIAEGGENVEMNDRLEERNESGVRRSSRTRRIKREYAEYLNEIHCKRLKCDLLRFAQTIELSVEPLTTEDYVNVNPTEVQVTLDKILLTWEKYVQTYKEYSRLINNTSELERIGLHRQNLERKIRDCKRVALDRVHESIENLNKREFGKSIARDVDCLSVSVRSRISAPSTMSSKCRSSGGSSLSSMAKTAARSAQLAKLKLQHAERKAQVKQRQIKEQIEENLQDLRDQAEYSQLEAQLLASDQIDGGSGSQSGESTPTKTSVLRTMGNVEQGLMTSTPKEDTVHRTNSKECVRVSERIKTPPRVHHTSSRSIEQDLTTTLVEMNQQLVGAVKQSAEATAVMKAMLQRQGVPRPQPTKFKGDPAQFPVFKKRVQDWLSERGFTEREKITRLLSFVEGDAKEAIEHCEIKEDGYTEALKILESQYGHPASVVKASLKRVTVGPRIEKGDDNSLTKLRNNLRACLEVLRDNKRYEYEINASSNLETVIDRLPTHMQNGQREFRRSATRSNQVLRYDTSLSSSIINSGL